MSKKTKAQLEKEIEALKAQLQIHTHVISDSSFKMETQIVWDSATVKTIDKVAQGLLNLTEVFSKQKVELPAMLTLDGVNGALVNGCNFQTDGEVSGISANRPSE